MSTYRGPGPCRDCGQQSEDRRQGDRCDACWDLHLRGRSDRWEHGRIALYRLYDAHGQLLYVGLTPTPETRWDDHQRRMPWWSEVVERDLTWLPPGRASAHRVEDHVILLERPWYNRSPMDEHGRPASGVLPEGCPGQPEYAWHPRRAEYWPAWFQWRALFRELQLNREERAALGR